MATTVVLCVIISESVNSCFRVLFEVGEKAVLRSWQKSSENGTYFYSTPFSSCHVSSNQRQSGSSNLNHLVKNRRMLRPLKAIPYFEMIFQMETYKNCCTKCSLHFLCFITEHHRGSIATLTISNRYCVVIRWSDWIQERVLLVHIHIYFFSFGKSVENFVSDGCRHYITLKQAGSVNRHSLIFSPLSD